MPRVAAVGRRAGQCVLPQGHKPSVGQRVVAVGFILFVQGDNRVVAVALFHPLHAEAWVGQQFVNSLANGLRGLAVVGEVGVLLVEAVVVINEVDGPQRTVFLHFAHHAPNAVAVVVVVLAVQADAVVAHGQQRAALRHIPAHTLVHHGLQVVGLALNAFLLEALGHVVLRKQHHGVVPRVAVGRGLHQRVRRRHLLVDGVAEVVNVELAMPVGHHGLVVVGPAKTVRGIGMLAVGAHNLDVVHSHNGRQAAVVAIGVGERRARVVYKVLSRGTQAEGQCGKEYEAFHCSERFVLYKQDDRLPFLSPFFPFRA